MVNRSKRSETEDSLDARIALLSSRRGVPVEAVPAPTPVSEVELPAHAPAEDRLLAAKEQLIARLSAEVRPERRSLLSRGELVDDAQSADQGLNMIGSRPRGRERFLRSKALPPPRPTGLAWRFQVILRSRLS